MEDTLMTMGLMVAFIWAAAEGIGRAVKKDKGLIALILGPLSGLVAVMAGWLTFDISEWKSYVVGAFVGLVATFGANLFNDGVVKKFQKRKK